MDIGRIKIKDNKEYVEKKNKEKVLANGKK